MLKGRKCVVTGGTRGIGLAIASALAEQGADVAVLGTSSPENVQKNIENIRCFGTNIKFYQCNVADFAAAKETCQAIIKDFGGIDILVNNAGITRDNLLLRMSEDDFDAVMAINLKGAFNFTKHLCNSLIKSPHGRIINIASVSGVMGNPGQANYSASKAGLIGLTKTMAKELAGRGVTCNAIAPGFIETDMTAVLREDVAENIKKAIPLKRLGQAKDVADLAVFLASDNAAYITGEVIKVDGGMCI